jgi:MFS family permease
VAGGSAVTAAAWIAMFPIAVAMFFAGGVANGLELVAIRSLLHHRVPDRLRGRAFAAYYGMIQAAQIVALGASGGLVELVGARNTMVFAGLGAAGVGVLGTMLYLTIPSEDRRIVAPAGVRPWVPA